MAIKLRKQQVYYQYAKVREAPLDKKL